jgi:hypothetical protein
VAAIEDRMRMRALGGMLTGYESVKVLRNRLGVEGRSHVGLQTPASRGSSRMTPPSYGGHKRMDDGGTHPVVSDDNQHRNMKEFIGDVGGLKENVGSLMYGFKGLGLKFMD